MSFCSEVKNEICAILPERPCCKKAMLNGAFAFFNTVSNSRIKMNTESASVARYINTLIGDTVGISPDVTIKKSDRIKGFAIEINDKEEILRIANELGLINKNTQQISGVIDGNLSVNPCCQRAVIKGAFLAAGSVTNPQKSYHFEISGHRRASINVLNELLISMDFNPKIIKRGADYVLYLKEKEAIADMLNLIGSKEMFFRFHDTLLMKEVKNKLNRKQNFEQANLSKTVNAAVEQNMAIRNIIDSNRFEELPDNLKELALLRMENPEASLSELSELLSEPLTRSGINHRLKKLTAIGLSIKK